MSPKPKGAICKGCAERDFFDLPQDTKVIIKTFALLLSEEFLCAKTVSLLLMLQSHKLLHIWQIKKVWFLFVFLCTKNFIQISSVLMCYLKFLFYSFLFFQCKAKRTDYCPQPHIVDMKAVLNWTLCRNQLHKSLFPQMSKFLNRHVEL